MPRLTTREYWNGVWGPQGDVVRISHLDRLKKWLRRTIGPSKISYFTRNYADYQIVEGVYRRHLAKGAGVIEIGSAPGAFLVDLHRRFGIVPFGVEYAPSGAAMNRQLFQDSGLNPDQVIESDAFAYDFQAGNAARFDVVISRGVIEHFAGDELRCIIAGHVNLLKPGGRLIVSIPNYRGINYLIKRIFSSGSLAAHNLDIMRRSTFAALFACAGLRPLRCDYVGTLDISMSQPPSGSNIALRATYQLFDKIQVLLNGILRSLLGTRGADSAFFSPFLIYVGSKI